MQGKWEGIVIRTIDYGEGNKILVLFTKEAGKVSVMARGAKKLKSRHSAIAQLFTYGEFACYAPGNAMGTLNSGDIVKSYHRLREDLHKSAFSAYLVEMVDKLLNDREGSAFLFDQLLAGLDGIEDEKDPWMIIHIFELKMLGFAGYAPVLDRCASCGEELQPPYRFSAALGGAACGVCKAKDAYAIPVQDRTYKLLRLMQPLDLRRLGRVEVSAEVKQELKKCMRAFMDAHLDIRWKSRSFLEQMEKYGI